MRPLAVRKIWPLLLLPLLPGMAIASASPAALRVSKTAPLSAREEHLRGGSIHNSEFADVPHTSNHSRCEQTHPPEALTTPNPILGPADPSLKVKVSFIVGADGRVHSPFILESAGNAEDQAILDVVRSWRYRPAMCNGVPTESEGRIEFSSR
jgi:TonB family protein